ncbi:uncharacterized protein LOC133792330 [Humulus lupulus]|uniref:uncharacterized protein LOC133792330 n=1 Tax=Humulus lupulus TaxID=3486 RepID=UPI002B40F650|nr:uncharacterized protein LOC133792330 [Humulus lupulus]
MGRKKKVILKPVAVSDETTVEDLPSIQEVEPELTTAEEFHEPCADFEMDRGTEEILNRSSPKAGNWAEEVEDVDFQNSAKEIWSKFKTNQVLTPSTRLVYTEPLKVGEQIVARLDLEEVEIEASFWKNAIVCIVLGANPPFRVFEGFVKRVWGKLGVDKIVRMHSGFTLVNFRDEVTRDLILETGVIHFDKKPVVLRPWTTDMDSVRMVKSVPVWIRMNGLGLQYWGKNSLSALVSTIGKPIMVDKVTQSREMVKYARVLVDMEISDHPPNNIAFINERGQLVEQSVEYEWIPSKCSACTQLGHIVANCNKEKGVVWRKKISVEKGEKSDQEINGSETVHEHQSEVSIPENIVQTSTSIDAEERGKSLSKDYESMERTDQGFRISSQLVGTDRVDSAGNWITPKRRGSRAGAAPNKTVTAPNKVVVAPFKTKESNGYAVLLESGGGQVVTNSNPILDGGL